MFKKCYFSFLSSDFNILDHKVMDMVQFDKLIDELIEIPFICHLLHV